MPTNRILDAAEVDRKHSRDRGKSHQISLFNDRTFSPQGQPQKSAVAAETTAQNDRKNNRENPPHKTTALNNRENPPHKTTAGSTAGSTADFPRLQIESVPVAERINPHEQRYVLVIAPQDIRACGGQLTAHEAHEVAKATRGWNWELDSNNRPLCLGQLEALLERICQSSARKGGEA